MPLVTTVESTGKKLTVSGTNPEIQALIDVVDRGRKAADATPAEKVAGNTFLQAVANA